MLRARVPQIPAGLVEISMGVGKRSLQLADPVLEGVDPISGLTELGLRGAGSLPGRGQFRAASLLLLASTCVLRGAGGLVGLGIVPWFRRRPAGFRLGPQRARRSLRQGADPA